MTNSGKVVANAGVANAKSQYTNAVALPKDLFTSGETKSTFANSASMPTLGSTSTPPPLANSATAPTQSGGKRKGAKKVAKKGKKGGALMDDVKNLAVPFAILLAKQGLQTMFDKKKKTASAGSELSARSASSASSARRRSTLTGGSCGSQCAAHVAPATGGAKRTSAAKRTTSKSTTAKSSSTRASSSRSSRGGAQGQQVKSRFEKLSKEIDEFLQKY